MSDQHTHEGCSGDCGSCGSSCDSVDVNQEGATIHLTLEDDTEVECAVLTIFPAADKEYIALLPLDEEGNNTDGEVFLYRFSESEEEGPTLENIDDDTEYKAAASAFDDILQHANEESETMELS